MSSIILSIDVSQTTDGLMSIYNRTSGDYAGKTFTLSAVLKGSKEDYSQTMTVEQSNQQWSLKPSLDGWYRFKLEMWQGTVLVDSYECDYFSLYHGYKCLNSMLLKAGCKCIDVDRWGNIYFKLASAKAAACNCMYEEAQCIIENLDKACKGC